MYLLLYVHVCVTRTGWKTRPRPKTVILPIKKSNQINQIIIIIIIAFGPYRSTGCLQELSRHPDPGPASQGIIIIIIIIIIAFGPYRSTGCLQELSRHPDPGPASQGIIIITIIIIIIAFGPYRSTGCLQEVSRHPDPGPASQVDPKCNPFSLFQPPDQGARRFLGRPTF